MITETVSCDICARPEPLVASDGPNFSFGSPSGSLPLGWMAITVQTTIKDKSLAEKLSPLKHVMPKGNIDDLIACIPTAPVTLTLHLCGECFGDLREGDIFLKVLHSKLFRDFNLSWRREEE